MSVLFSRVSRFRRGLGHGRCCLPELMACGQVGVAVYSVPALCSACVAVDKKITKCFFIFFCRITVSDDRGGSVIVLLCHVKGEASNEL